MDAERAKVAAWAARLDPGNYVKGRAAGYHTAPSVIPRKSPDFPKGMPADAVCISFFIDGESWLGPPSKVELKGKGSALFEMKAPKGKAKHAPVVVMGKDAVYAVVPVAENYYFAAYEMVGRDVRYLAMKPGRSNDAGKSKVYVVAVFVPEEGE